ncbi:hypothetical protein PN462_14020 [Spirulina sp. CS-785/01]|uniref:hypothetical protein n=1 Tax=Spirulina sp. CS-785/01 TaxID=3021716 RepID=UPI00232EA419|nr:hypothetical protein [Spirulina sp. CS-785/01]MDB9314225.1 hypothetical protein [Spirulina sp. CS-785/01]
MRGHYTPSLPSPTDYTGTSLQQTRTVTPSSPPSTHKIRSLHAQPQKRRGDEVYSEQVIAEFFTDAVMQESPEQVLDHFKDLFILKNNQVGVTVEQALYDLIILKHKETFLYVVQRVCFILVKYWWLGDKQDYIPQLLDLFKHNLGAYHNLHPTHRRLRQWLREFVQSEGYENLTLFLPSSEKTGKQPWTERYKTYLLAAQYLNTKNPREQREAAEYLAAQLNQQFKFKLAIYTAHAQLSKTSHGFRKNPTLLDDRILLLIQRVINKQKSPNYQGLANIFRQQADGISYRGFKYGFLKYLFHSLEDSKTSEWLRASVANAVKPLYRQYNDKPWNNHLLLRTSNRLIEYLLQPNWSKSTHPLAMLTHQGNYLTLTILLLKIVLLCRPSYKYLMVCLARLIHYYEDVPQGECDWLVKFLETLRVVLTISAETFTEGKPLKAHAH